MSGESDATKASQLLLRRVNPNLRADGVWGRSTQSAYTAAGGSIKSVVDTILESYDLSGATMFKGDDAVVHIESLVLRSDAVAYIRQVAETTGLRQYADSFERMLDLENPAVKKEGKVYFDPLIRNSIGYRGLAQADPNGRFWADARTVDPMLEDFEVGWSDWKQSCRAIVAYQKLYIPIVAGNVPNLIVTGDVMYLIHNQGPTGAARILRGKSKGAYEQQSVAARAIIDANFGRFA